MGLGMAAFLAAANGLDGFVQGTRQSQIDQERADRAKADKADADEKQRLRENEKILRDSSTQLHTEAGDMFKDENGQDMPDALENRRAHVLSKLSEVAGTQGDDLRAQQLAEASQAVRQHARNKAVQDFNIADGANDDQGRSAAFLRAWGQDHGFVGLEPDAAGGYVAKVKKGDEVISKSMSREELGHFMDVAADPEAARKLHQSHTDPKYLQEIETSKAAQKQHESVAANAQANAEFTRQQIENSRMKNGQIPGGSTHGTTAGNGKLTPDVWHGTLKSVNDFDKTLPTPMDAPTRQAVHGLVVSQGLTPDAAHAIVSQGKVTADNITVTPDGKYLLQPKLDVNGQDIPFPVQASAPASYEQALAWTQNGMKAHPDASNPQIEAQRLAQAYGKKPDDVLKVLVPGKSIPAAFVGDVVSNVKNATTGIGDKLNDLKRGASDPNIPEPPPAQLPDRYGLMVDNPAFKEWDAQFGDVYRSALGRKNARLETKDIGARNLSEAVRKMELEKELRKAKSYNQGISASDIAARGLPQ
jgi:hypothetical protein